jgi:hypothetical protein
VWVFPSPFIYYSRFLLIMVDENILSLFSFYPYLKAQWTAMETSTLMYVSTKLFCFILILFLFHLISVLCFLISSPPPSHPLLLSSFPFLLCLSYYFYFWF